MRRIVTGSRDGVHTVLIDEQTEARPMLNRDAGRVHELWNLDSMKLDPTDRVPAEDPTLENLGVGQGQFKIVQLPVYDLEGSFEQYLHGAETINLWVVLSGSFETIMEDGTSVLLEPGDSMVELGSQRAFRNPGPEPCVAAIVVLGAEAD